VNPKVHFARMNTSIPGLKKFEDEPIDRHVWEQILKSASKDYPPQPSSATHPSIFPSARQLTGVVNILMRGYLNPLYYPNNNVTQLCDAVGVGKT
jgi:hypothetical protein